MITKRSVLASVERVWKVCERPQQIRRPEDMQHLWKGAFKNDSREHFMMLPLDARHKPMTEPIPVSTGSLNASLVHPREVFGPALALRAAAIVVAHNHPSGSTKPSEDDMELTQRLDAAGELLGVPLLDHIIVTNGDIHGEEMMDMLSLREYGWPSKQPCDG